MSALAPYGLQDAVLHERLDGLGRYRAAAAELDEGDFAALAEYLSAQHSP
jgi:hypothetical protein